MAKKLIIITNHEILTRARLVFSQKITAKEFQSYTLNQYAMNSLLAMCSDWNRYIAFCQCHHYCPLSATDVLPVRHFLESEATQRKYASIRRYSITIGLVFRLLNYSDPTTKPEVRRLLMSLRLDKKGDEKQSDAFNSRHLSRLNSLLCKSKNVLDIRDLAIYYLMFECALKRGELRDLTKDQIDQHHADITVNIQETHYALSEKAARAIIKWMSYIHDDEIIVVFRSIDRHGHIAASPLNDSSIYRILRHAATRLNQPGLKFSGQSARIGAAQELHKQGQNVSEIQEFGRWNSPIMPMQYIGNKASANQTQLRYKSFKPWH